jgi:hypothetical protein
VSPATVHDAGRRIDHVRDLLARADADELGPRRDHAASAKAQAYVLLAAGLEFYVRETLTQVLKEIGSRAVRLADLRVTLFAVVSAPGFDSMGAVGGLKKWRKRVEVLSQTLESGTYATGSVGLPLDGRTLRPAHFQLVWAVFGFPTSPLPGPLHALALSDLAEGRNAVAHGNVDAVVFGRGKAITDVRRLADRVEEIVLHTEYAADLYLGQSLYMR